jgi:hypothetical protein
MASLQTKRSIEPAPFATTLEQKQTISSSPSLRSKQSGITNEENCMKHQKGRLAGDKRSGFYHGREHHHMMAGS